MNYACVLHDSVYSCTLNSEEIILEVKTVTAERATLPQNQNLQRSRSTVVCTNNCKMFQIDVSGNNTNKCK
jgi:hypothetical protein